jgi:DTW domain-containing protein YfiP
MSDGGKGSKPRPFNISDVEYTQRHNQIFGEKKRYCQHCGKTFSWCQCVNNTGTNKNEYHDFLTEDCLTDD